MAPAAAGLPKVPTPYPEDKTPEMRQAFDAFCAESDGAEVNLRLYRERYYAPSPGAGPGATWYYSANIVFVKKMARADAFCVGGARAVGTAGQEVARAHMIADFRAERPNALGSSWGAPNGPKLPHRPTLRIRVLRRDCSTGEPNLRPSPPR